MNSYNNMKLHLTRHVYMRGMFKGDAPVDRRGKNHFRVVQAPSYRDEMYVRFHNANLITAKPDGSFKLDCRGWSGSITTKMAMSEASWRFCGTNISIHSRVIMSQKQEVVTVKGKTYIYYDGMEFSAEGALLSTPKPFEMRRINRDETKQYALDIKESGFKDMFPILYATCTQEQARDWLNSRAEEITTRDYEAVRWPILIAKHKYYGWSGGQERDMKTTWASIMKDAKVSMYNVSASAITVL